MRLGLRRRLGRRARRAGLALIVLVALAPQTVGGAPPGEEGPTAETPAPLPATGLDEESILISGYLGELDHEFRIAPGFQPSADGLATMTFRVPNLVVDATVSAFLNGDPVGTWLLGDGPTDTALEIPLATTTLETGVNVLRLETAAPLSIDDSCREADHPARWIAITAPIAIDVPVTAGPLPELDEFTDAFAGDQVTTIVIDRADRHYLTLAATFAAGLAADVGRDHEVIVTTSSDAPPPGSGPVVRIAVDAANPGVELATESGDTLLTVRGSDMEQLTKIVDVLATPARRSLLTGSRADQSTVAALAPPIDDTPLVDAELSPEWLSGVTLRALGREGATLEGPGVESVSYGFDIPIGDTASEMTIVLQAAASVGSDSWNPGVDVYVNGRLVGNAELDASIRDHQFDVGSDALRPGANFVRFEADFGTAGGGCRAASTPTHRVDISPDTLLRLYRGNSLGIDLDHLPYLLRTEVDTAASVVVTPLEPTSTEVTEAIRLAVLLGGRGRAAEVTTADEFAQRAEQPRNQILLGTPARQPALDALIDALPVPADTPELWPAEIERQLDGQSYPGNVQMLENPLARDGIIIVVSGSDDAAALAAVAALNDTDLRSEMSGAVALVGDAVVRSVLVEDQVVIDDDRAVAPSGSTASGEPAAVDEVPIEERPTGEPEEAADNRGPLSGRAGFVVLALALAGLAILGFTRFRHLFESARTPA